jgi:hypothetical protein
MKILKITSVLFMLLISACATSTGPTYRWVKIFEGKIPFEQASAQCDYEAHLQAKADARADAGGGIGYLLMGMPNPTKAMCMRRFGWEARKIEQQDTQQQLSQTKTSTPTSEEAQTLKALQEGAERGDVVAQVNLAWRYLSGIGVNKSNALAYKWYSSAADKIDVNRTMARNAQTNLGVIWNLGLGVQRDSVKAMMWFIVASSSGEKESTKLKKELESLMLETEITEAKRLAAVCVAKKYKSCEEPMGKKWKTCDFVSAFSVNKELEKMIGTWDLTMVVGKDVDNADARLVLFSKNDLTDTMVVDFDLTSNGTMEDKSKYTSYKTKVGFGKVEESKENGNIIFSMGSTAEASVDVRAQCK